MGRQRVKDEKEYDTVFFSFEMDKTFNARFEEAVGNAKTTKKKYVLSALQEKMESNPLEIKTEGVCPESVGKLEEKISRLEEKLADSEKNVSELKSFVDSLTKKYFDIDSDIREISKKL